MPKTRNCVFPVAVCIGLLVVSFSVVTVIYGAIVLAQEAPVRLEEQKQARETLNKGVQNFKNGQYDEAIANFERAKDLDPQFMDARLYLATAYAAQYIPGAPSEENVGKGRRAVVEFKRVLILDPQNLSAIDGIGSILFQMAGQPYDPDKFAESKSQFLKHCRLRPDDPEPYYWIGVIDWTLSFRANGELRENYNKTVRGDGLRTADPLPVEVREQYTREYGSIIDEGIDALKQAIELRPEYDDAMAYLNLLYRRKADTVAYTSERDAMTQIADDLVDRIKEIKRRRAEAPKRP
jgi:tetratricopeptide (TPR) repeat protein